MQTLFEILTNDRNVAMQYELAAMLCAFFVTAALLRERRRITVAWGIIFLIFIYLHRVLLPFLLAGAYLLLLGGLAAAFVRLEPKAFFLPFRVLRDKVRIYTGASVLPLTAVILTILLIQLCRINIGIDYDSIRYGLRSDVLLTNGRGIRGFFENTGLVNSVYLYPKGFELLTRPLYVGGTLGAVLCVNVWILIFVLQLSGALVRTVADADEAEVFGATMVALMPGVTNMSVTAKSDLATLLCQLGFLYCVLRYLRKLPRQKMGGGRSEAHGGDGQTASDAAIRKTRQVTPSDAETLHGTTALPGIGIGALVLSYACKPTALVFSSFLGLTALWYFARRRIQLHGSAEGLRAQLPACVLTGIVTARTWVITGQPVAGLFSGVFEKLGMQLHYPFRSMQMLDAEDALRLTDRLRQFLLRLCGFLFCPTGEGMEHVLMAWGGLAFLLLLLAICLFGRDTRRKMDELTRLWEIGTTGCRFDAGVFGYLCGSWAVMGAASLVSLYLLYQVDGNYFMLLYVLTAVLGTAVLFTGIQYEQSSLGRNFRKVLSGGGSAALVLLCAVMIYFTAFTGWCGPVGFTPVDVINRGYYSHEAEYLRELGIWDKQARVVAFAYDPACYQIKGRLESWVDIDGSGGNVYLTDTKFDIFKEYLAFADIDYLYADLNYLNDTLNPRRERAGVLFQWLLEDGSFEDVFLLPYSSHEIVAKLDKARVAVGWETPMSAEQAAHAAAQGAWFAEVRR